MSGKPGLAWPPTLNCVVQLNAPDAFVGGGTSIAEPEPRNGLNSYASPSPVVAPGRVFVHFGTYGTAGPVSKPGQPIWPRVDRKCDHPEGRGSSPLLQGGRLFLHLDGADVQYLVALDPETGETLWKTERSADLEPRAPRGRAERPPRGREERRRSHAAPRRRFARARRGRVCSRRPRGRLAGVGIGHGTERRQGGEGFIGLQHARWK